MEALTETMSSIDASDDAWRQRWNAKHPVKIIVNNRDVDVPGHDVTGAQIKQAAEVPADFKLYGPSGSEIADEQTVRVKHDERFTAISGQDVS